MAKKARKSARGPYEVDSPFGSGKSGGGRVRFASNPSDDAPGRADEGHSAPWTFPAAGGRPDAPSYPGVCIGWTSSFANPGAPPGRAADARSWSPFPRAPSPGLPLRDATKWTNAGLRGTEYSSPFPAGRSAQAGFASPFPSVQRDLGTPRGASLGRSFHAGYSSPFPDERRTPQWRSTAYPEAPAAGPVWGCSRPPLASSFPTFVWRRPAAISDAVLPFAGGNISGPAVLAAPPLMPPAPSTPTVSFRLPPEAYSPPSPAAPPLAMHGPSQPPCRAPGPLPNAVSQLRCDDIDSVPDARPTITILHLPDGQRLLEDPASGLARPLDESVGQWHEVPLPPQVVASSPVAAVPAALHPTPGRVRLTLIPTTGPPAPRLRRSPSPAHRSPSPPQPPLPLQRPSPPIFVPRRPSPSPRLQPPDPARAQAGLVPVPAVQPELALAPFEEPQRRSSIRTDSSFSTGYTPSESEASEDVALLQQYARKRERFLQVRAELRDQMQSLRSELSGSVLDSPADAEALLPTNAGEPAAVAAMFSVLDQLRRKVSHALPAARETRAEPWPRPRRRQGATLRERPTAEAATPLVVYSRPPPVGSSEDEAPPRRLPPSRGPELAGRPPPSRGVVSRQVPTSLRPGSSAGSYVPPRPPSVPVQSFVVQADPADEACGVTVFPPEPLRSAIVPADPAPEVPRPAPVTSLPLKLESLSPVCIPALLPQALSDSLSLPPPGLVADWLGPRGPAPEASPRSAGPSPPPWLIPSRDAAVVALVAEAAALRMHTLSPHLDQSLRLTVEERAALARLRERQRATATPTALASTASQTPTEAPTPEDPSVPVPRKRWELPKSPAGAVVYDHEKVQKYLARVRERLSQTEQSFISTAALADAGPTPATASRAPPTPEASSPGAPLAADTPKEPSPQPLAKAVTWPVPPTAVGIRDAQSTRSLQLEPAKLHGPDHPIAGPTSLAAAAAEGGGPVPAAVSLPECPRPAREPPLAPPKAAAALPSAIPLSEDSDDIFLPAHESLDDDLPFYDAQPSTFTAPRQAGLPTPGLGVLRSVELQPPVVDLSTGDGTPSPQSPSARGPTRLVPRRGDYLALPSLEEEAALSAADRALPGQGPAKEADDCTIS